MAAEYVQGARDGGHDAKLVRAADLDLPLLRSQSLFAMPPEEEAIGALQRDLKWADHLVIGFPLWLGAPPAVLKGLLEQIARGSFIAEVDRRGWRPQLAGRSARILVTMGAPSLYYSFVQGGHGVAALRENVLRFGGFAPVRTTYFGAMGQMRERERARRLAHVRGLGARGV